VTAPAVTAPAVTAPAVDFIGQDQEAFGMDQIARFIAGDPSATPA